MVISASVDNLLVGSVVDSITYAGRGTEIEGTILYRSDLACYRYIGIDWCVSIGIEIEYLIHDITSRVATEAEVAVVGEIDDSRLVSSGFVGNGDSVVVGECISYLDRQIAREAVFAIGTDGGEGDATIADRLGLPHAVVESDVSTTVEAVAIVVARQLVCDAI